MCMDQIPKYPENKSKVTVLGLGGSGYNILERLKNKGADCNFIYTDWDDNVLGTSSFTAIKMKGESETNYFDSLKNEIGDSEKLIVISGLGGEFGSYVSPIIGVFTTLLNIDTEFIVSLPPMFEGKKRTNLAKESLDLIKKSVPACEAIEFDSLLEKLSRTVSLKDFYKIMDEVICQKIWG